MPVRLVSQEELPGPLKGYRLIERLGRGGFGEVWKVEAPGGLHKAAKFVFGDLDALDEESRPAEQEAKALERVKGIRHPYILSLEQFRVIDGQLIIVMELADRNLWDRFRECRSQGLPGIPRDELMRYMEETAEALDLMNNHYQIQHLDVKPQNIFLVFNHVKVADFGLAKVLEGVKATVTGGVTPVYAAPETFEGWVSRFSDQYSLGIVFQELLTGSRPFNGTNTRQLLMQHINGTPDLNPLPPADRPVIARSLAKKPDDRWPTCSEMVRGLKQAGQATPPPAAPPAGPARAAGPPPARPAPGSGTATMAHPTGHALADSLQVTRPVHGASAGGAGPAARDRTPPPVTLPPLVKPGQSAPGAPAPSSLLRTPGSTPRLVTPSAAAAAHPAQTLTRAAVLQTARMGSLGVAPPEKTGDGALFPALVVALGRTGRLVAEQLKQAIADRHGSAERTPNVRILYVDTDVEVAADPPADHRAALAAREVVLARLNRSTHYLQRDSLPPVEQWLPAGALYKLPRNPTSAAGVRAFGRLALIDNYRDVAQRVRQEVETFLTDEPLARADAATRLGLRTNRPRAYVVGNLAGGTGGGMFLDAAYLVRNELRQVGYLRPEVVGVFFVPPADSKASRSPALGNAFAALAELNHFQAKKTRYQAAFDKGEAPVTDGDAPFARVALLQLPRTPEPAKTRAALATAARALYQELLTPAGRVADEGRDVYRNAFPAKAPACQTFGLFRLSWPRPEVLSAATGRLAQRQLQRWTAKEAVHLREPIAEWFAQQWAERRLAFEAVADALNAAAKSALREEPERVFDALVDPLRTRTPSGGRLDAASACAVLEQLIRLVGKPGGEDSGAGSAGTVAPALNARFEQLAKESEGHVAVMAATFLEVPHYRLAGAEEAVRQIGERLKRQVDALEPLRDELDREVRGTYSRLIQSIGALGSGSLGATVAWKSYTAEVVDLLRAYPRKRLQLSVLEMALSIFRKLLGNAPEFLREMNFYRATLNDFHAALAAAAAQPPAAVGKMILPDGCADLNAAADQFLAGLAPEDLLDFDQSLQKNIARKFRGLGSVCLKPVEKGPAFRELLLTRAREFLDARLEHSNPATVFFRSRKQAGSAESLVAEAFNDAVPGLLPPGQRPYEMTVLGVPPGDDGRRLLDLARAALPDLEFVAAALPDDICFYREFPQVPLADLPQLSAAARDAYEKMAADHPPHSRTDVPWQQPGT
jgi:hypothetical protein